MPTEVLYLFAIAFALFGMQSIGGIWQIRNFKNAVHRVHKLGNVGFGQRRGRFFNGYLVVLACDKDRIITGCEVMDGKTFLARCHPIDTLLGKTLIGASIDSFLAEFRAMDAKQQKRYRGYIMALEALEMRLAPKPDSTPQDEAPDSTIPDDTPQNEAQKDREKRVQDEERGLEGSSTSENVIEETQVQDKQQTDDQLVKVVGKSK